MLFHIFVVSFLLGLWIPYSYSAVSKASNVEEKSSNVKISDEIYDSPKSRNMFRNRDDGDLAPLTPQVLIQGAGFWFGTQMYTFEDKLAPVAPPDGSRLRQHVPKMQDFWIDIHSVTNAQFKSFVDATGYKTEAERYRWSFVLDYEANEKTKKEVDGKKGYGRVKEAKHWMAVKGASWRYPFGSADKSIQKLNLLQHPVVQVSFQDAEEYCHWASGTDDEENEHEKEKEKERKCCGEEEMEIDIETTVKDDTINGKVEAGKPKKRVLLRLPTEFEYEFAARGGLYNQTFPWGNENPSIGTGIYSNNINIWHEKDENSKFPTECDISVDGHVGTAPALYYAPNGYGVYNMVGNVWEWVLGGTVEKRTLRGASYVDSLDGKYNHAATVASKQTNSPDSSATNTGFRCVSGGKLNIIREEYFTKEQMKRDAEQDIRSKKRNAEHSAKREQGLKRKREAEAKAAADADAKSNVKPRLKARAKAKATVKSQSSAENEKVEPKNIEL